MATAINILRKGLCGKTPTSCSSTKLAELSNPLMPSKAAEKPKQIATRRSLPTGNMPRLPLKM